MGIFLPLHRVPAEEAEESSNSAATRRALTTAAGALLSNVPGPVGALSSLATLGAQSLDTGHGVVDAIGDRGARPPKEASAPEEQRIAGLRAHDDQLRIQTKQLLEDVSGFLQCPPAPARSGISRASAKSEALEYYMGRATRRWKNLLLLAMKNQRSIDANMIESILNKFDPPLKNDNTKRLFEDWKKQARAMAETVGSLSELSVDEDYQSKLDGFAKQSTLDFVTNPDIQVLQADDKRDEAPRTLKAFLKELRTKAPFVASSADASCSSAEAKRAAQARAARSESEVKRELATLPAEPARQEIAASTKPGTAESSATVEPLNPEDPTRLIQDPEARKTAAKRPIDLTEADIPRLSDAANDLFARINYNDRSQTTAIENLYNEVKAKRDRVLNQKQWRVDQEATSTKVRELFLGPGSSWDHQNLFNHIVRGYAARDSDGKIATPFRVDPAKVDGTLQDVDGFKPKHFDEQIRRLMQAAETKRQNGAYPDDN